MTGEHPGPVRTTTLDVRQRCTLALLATYLAVQLLVPLRHFLLYPGYVSWTNEGKGFSWHMKLNEKSAVGTFQATDPVRQKTITIDPKRYLTRRQRLVFLERPDMILQFSHHIANQLRKQGHDQIEVRAKILVSLNGRQPQLLIDPTVNLAAQPRTLRPAPWIMPLTEPLSQYRDDRRGNDGWRNGTIR